MVGVERSRPETERWRTQRLAVLFVFVTPTNRRQTNLFAAQFDIKFIPWLEVKKGRVGLADQQVAIALHCGHIAELRPPLPTPPTPPTPRLTPCFQKRFIESGEIQTFPPSFFVET